jgi:hypothetical protein
VLKKVLIFRQRYYTRIHNDSYITVCRLQNSHPTHTRSKAEEEIVPLLQVKASTLVDASVPVTNMELDILKTSKYTFM